MTKNQFVAVFVRLAGLYMFVTNLPGLPLIVKGIWQPGALADPTSWLNLTVVVVWLTAALCMIAFPITVTGNVLDRHGDQPLAFNWTPNQIESVAFSLLGLYFCILGVRHGFYRIAYYFVEANESHGIFRGQMYWSPGIVAEIAAEAAEFLIGVWLLFGATGLRGLLRWARHSGGGPAEVSLPET